MLPETPQVKKNENVYIPQSTAGTHTRPPTTHKYPSHIPPIFPPPPHPTTTSSCPPLKSTCPISRRNQVYCGSSTPQNSPESRANTRRRPPHATRRGQATTAHNKQTKPQVTYHHLPQRRASSDVTHIRRRPALRTVPPSAKSTTEPENVVPASHHLPPRESNCARLP